MKKGLIVVAVLAGGWGLLYGYSWLQWRRAPMEAWTPVADIWVYPDD